MGFSSKWVWVWVLLPILLLLTPNVSFADSTQRDLLQATVLVINSAHVAPAVVREAERDSARIFRVAGIDVVWVNCGPVSSEASCPAIGDANQFVLHIVPHGTAFTDKVFGVAFLGDDDRGRYCDVFFEGIAAIENEFQAGTSQLLGAVMTHELGHLLLGSHAHSPVGIMMPAWYYDGIRQVDMGTLFFTREESSRIQARVKSGMFKDGTSETVLANRREPYLLFLGSLQ